MQRLGVFEVLVLLFFILVGTQSATAQYFGNTPSPAAEKSKQVVSPSSVVATQNVPTKKENTYSVVDTAETDVGQEIEKIPASSPFDYAYGKQSNKKTEPAKEPYHRYSTVGGVTVETTEENPEDELIMLYMKNFSIYKSPSGQTRCSARFAVLTTLPVRLSNISYRLKWPKMETTLSFNDIDPGVENHFDYALLGDGCYSMDRQPNIVVNRCRAKGMTQRQCASKIRWIKEM